MKRIIAIIMLFLACGFGLQAKNYVVCVGIADYPGTEDDLHLSATDAVTIKELYEKNGNAEVVYLTNEEATVSKIKATTMDMFGKASAADAIIFFFSGHGLPGCFVCYDGFLMYDMLTDIMSKSLANCKMIFADACFAGKARQENKDERPRNDGNVLFFLSSRSDETSAERKFGWKNSMFTGYLERGLRGGADLNKDRVITARELFLFVSKGVADQTRQKQHPVMWGRFDDNMPVMSWKKK